MILFATIGLCNVLCTYSVALQDSYNVLLHDKANYKVDLIITEDDYEMIGKDQLKDFKLDPKDNIRLSEFKRIVQAANLRTTTRIPEKKVDLNALKDKATSTQSSSTSTTTDVVTPMFSDEPFMTVSTDEIMPMYPELTSSSEYTVLPLYSEDANMPMASEDANTPMSSDETIMPMSSEKTILPMSSEEPNLPMSSAEELIPMSSDETILPMASEETFIPMASEEPYIPMASEKPNIPMSSEEAITPISDEAGMPISLDDAFTTLYLGDTDSLFSIPPEDLAMPIIVVTGNTNQLFTNYMGLPRNKHAIKKREIKAKENTRTTNIKGTTKRITIKESTKKIKTKEKAKESTKAITIENATEYDYDSLVEEYYEQEIIESRSKDTYQIRRTVLSDYGALNMMKSIFLLRPEKENCTQNDNGIGIQAIRCLLNDYSNQRQVTKDLSARTWRIVQIWLLVYLGIAIPVWCTRGWCCCFLRCKFFKPRQTIDEAKKYVVSYPPGVFKKKNGELITYDPSTREKECYEEFEHFIKTL